MRVVVVGTSGCGKTTFARALARRLTVPHVELDALHWGPSWIPRPPEQFRADVAAAVRAPAWVCDGNYSAVRDLVWPAATTLVWLDYAFPIVFGRAVRRTLTRMITREELFGGNRESFRFLFDPEGIPWWVIRTFRRRRREYPLLFGRPEHAHLRIIRFRRSSEARQFLTDPSL